MPLYPSPYLPPVRLAPVATHEKEKRSVHALTCGTHVSTHVDAPFHAIPDGLTLDRVPLEHLVGEARMIRISGRDRRRPIDRPDFSGFDGLEACEKLVLNTGWSERTWGAPEYFTEGPCLTRSAAVYLADLPKLHLLGMDFPNIDTPEDTKPGVVCPNHQILLGRRIALLENLSNLSSLSDRFFLSAAPPNVIGADGFPCRAIAIFPLDEWQSRIRP